MAKEKREKKSKPVEEVVEVTETAIETPTVVKKEKKEKKSKKGSKEEVETETVEVKDDAEDAPAKKVKKEKKSKKVDGKVVEEKEDVVMEDAPKKEKKSKSNKTDDDDEEADGSEASPDTPAGTKRKADLEELEVDLTAPEPPSKRAKRALKKGKNPKSQAKKSGDDSDVEDGSDAEDGKKKKKKERSEHSVWIGNLPFHLTGADLKKWLVDNSGGVIESSMITRVKLPTQKNPPNRAEGVKPFNKGFAYVDFSDIAPKVSVIAMTESDMGGRKLLIKDASSFEGRPEKKPEEEDEVTGPLGPGGVKVDPNASRKIFVGNMSFSTTEADVTRNFEPCGEIEWTKIATFEDSGKCKGYGWVKFKEPEAAAWAVKGFVKIKEAIETEDDFRSDDEEEDEEKKKLKEQQKKFKTRKWYVNRIQGRELKLELAEDDQTRYKKRFKGKPRVDGGESGEVGQGGGKENGGGERRERRPRREENGGERKERKEEVKPKTSKNIDVARLTGGLVEHTGTKMSFD